MVGEYALAFIVYHRLVNVGAHIQRVEVDAAGHRFPGTVADPRPDVLGKDEFRIVVPEILRFGPALLHAAVEHGVLGDERLARLVIEIDHMAFKVFHGADARIVPTVRRVGDPVRD